jgi:hypothetical protein
MIIPLCFRSSSGIYIWCLNSSAGYLLEFSRTFNGEIVLRTCPGVNRNLGFAISNIEINDLINYEVCLEKEGDSYAVS